MYAIRSYYGCIERPLRVDQLLERLVLQQTAVDDPHCGDADDLVPRRRLEPGRFRIEDRVGQLAQPACLQVGRWTAVREEIEIIVLGATLDGA